MCQMVAYIHRKQRSTFGTDAVTEQQTTQVLWFAVSKRAAVTVVGTRLALNDLVAAVRRVIGAVTLLTIVVPYVVRVLPLKLKQ
jgi:hypothetical protein